MAEPSSTRRWYRQFSLRGLLIALALVAIAFGIWSNASAYREWRALHSFDKSLQVSLTRRNSLGSLQYLENKYFSRGLGSPIGENELGDDLSVPWALWREDTVQSLSLYSTEPHMSATALDPLMDIPTVDRLELKVDEMDPQSLQSLQSLRQLELLEWSGNFDEACLLALPRLPGLKRLELEPKACNRLGKGLQALERLQNLSHFVLTVDHSNSRDMLRHARFSSTPLAVEIGMNPHAQTNSWPLDLSDMRAWSSVYYLKLESIETNGPIDFASMPNLQTVDLNDVNLSDADVDQLTRLPKLERLTLERTGINDEQLARVLRIPKLKGIVISEYGVTSVAFAGLPDSKHLEFLNVPESIVDATFLEALRKTPAVKHCEVVHEIGLHSDIAPLQWQINEALQRK